MSFAFNSNWTDSSFERNSNSYFLSGPFVVLLFLCCSSFSCLRSRMVRSCVNLLGIFEMSYFFELVVVLVDQFCLECTKFFSFDGVLLHILSFLDIRHLSTLIPAKEFCSKFASFFIIDVFLLLWVPFPSQIAFFRKFQLLMNIFLQILIAHLPQCLHTSSSIVNNCPMWIFNLVHRTLLFISISFYHNIEFEHRLNSSLPYMVIMNYFFVMQKLQWITFAESLTYIYYPIKALICSTLCDESQTTRYFAITKTNNQVLLHIVFRIESLSKALVSLSSELMKYISFPNASRASLIWKATAVWAARPTKRTTSFLLSINLLFFCWCFDKLAYFFFQIAPWYPSIHLILHYDNEKE